MSAFAVRKRGLMLIAPLAIAGLMLGGWPGGLVAVVAAIAIVWAPQLIGPYALAAIVLTGLEAIVEQEPATAGSLSSFVADRPVTSEIGLVAAVLVAVYVIERAVSERDDARVVPLERDTARPLGRGAGLSFAAGAVLTTALVAPGWWLPATGASAAALVLPGLSTFLRRGSRAGGRRGPVEP